MVFVLAYETASSVHPLMDEAKRLVSFLMGGTGDGENWELL